MEKKRCSCCKREKPISHFGGIEARRRMCSKCRMASTYYKRKTPQWIDKIVRTLKPRDY